MYLSQVLALACLLVASSGTPLHSSTKAAAPRGAALDVKEKYFSESSFHPHYDRRFAQKPLESGEQKVALQNLLQTYVSTFADLGMETWLVHGSLLGWYWNKKILPWDSDIDVQVTEPTMAYMAAYYNMSSFHYRTPRIASGRDYLLEVNPHWRTADRADRLNKIDARWIDTASGLFIDITTARHNATHPKGPFMMGTKDGHEFRDMDVFPLRNTDFEGANVKVPYKYKDLLVGEYGRRCLTQTTFHSHVFDEEKMEWTPAGSNATAKMSKPQDDSKAAPPPPPNSGSGIAKPPPPHLKSPEEIWKAAADRAAAQRQRELYEDVRRTEEARRRREKDASERQYAELKRSARGT